MSLPHSRCNYISKNVLVGACPYVKLGTLQKMLDFGVEIFIDLREQCDYKVPNTILSYHFPIKSGYPPTLKQAEDIFEIVKSNSTKIIYIHCSGGHGRAGALGAYIIGKINKLDCAEAVLYIENARATRIDKSRNFVPTPEMTRQIKFLHNELGLKPGNSLPDRSDTSWLKLI